MLNKLKNLIIFQYNETNYLLLNNFILPKISYNTQVNSNFTYVFLYCSLAGLICWLNASFFCITLSINLIKPVLNFIEFTNKIRSTYKIHLVPTKLDFRRPPWPPLTILPKTYYPNSPNARSHCPTRFVSKPQSYIPTTINRAGSSFPNFLLSLHLFLNNLSRNSISLY